jgi:hypothetical protein
VILSSFFERVSVKVAIKTSVLGVGLFLITKLSTFS